MHGGFGFGSRNKEGERLLELGTATDMVVCNTLFRKRLSRLIKYESGGLPDTDRLYPSQKVRQEGSKGCESHIR